MQFYYCPSVSTVQSLTQRSLQQVRMARRATNNSVTHLVAGLQLCVIAISLPSVLRLLRVRPRRAFRRDLACWLASRGTIAASKRVPVPVGLLEPVLGLRLYVSAASQHVWWRVVEVPRHHTLQYAL